MSIESPRRLAPNPNCALYCGVLETDRSGMAAGTPQAAEDFERHCVQSNECSGIELRPRGDKVRVFCPLFGVETEFGS